MMIDGGASAILKQTRLVPVFVYKWDLHNALRTHTAHTPPKSSTTATYVVQIVERVAACRCSLFTSASFTSTNMANFAAQLKDRFFGLVDRVAGCGRTGVKAEAPKSAPVPAVQEVCLHFTRKRKFNCFLLYNDYSVVAGELTVLLLLLFQHVEIRPRGPNVSGGSEAGVN